MKPLEIFGHQLARAKAIEGDLKGQLDMECSIPRFRVVRIEKIDQPDKLLDAMDKVKGRLEHAIA